MQTTMLKTSYRGGFFADDDIPEKLIEAAHVLKGQKTTDFSKIIEVEIEHEQINKIDKENSQLKKLSASLRKLNLSFNCLTQI